MIGRFNVIDRFAEKYYRLTTYQYGANNPIKNIDVNGDSIRVFSSKGTNANGAFVGTENITSKMFLKGFEKSMKSRDFRGYISQYATKGLKIGRYYFSKDGEFANAKLTITEYNLNAADQGTIDALNGGHLEGYHTIGLNADGTGVEANMHIYTRNHSTAGEIAETMGHESQLHGYKDKYLIRGFNKSGISRFNSEKKKYDSGERGKKDHDALGRNDQRHEGVIRYKRFEEEREQ